MDRKNVLICGATGFIGRNLAERFAEDERYQVFGTYNKRDPYFNDNIEFLKADLRDKENVKRVIEGKDIVINAAAITSGSFNYKTERDISSNIEMNSNIIQESYNSQVGHMFFLSCSIMYPSSLWPAREEDADLGNLHPKYFLTARMKVFFEDMCKYLSGTQDNKTKFTAVRHSNIYGPYDKFDQKKAHVFGATISRVSGASEGGEVVIWGHGNEERDLLYVSDLGDFVNLAIEGQKNPYEIYNVGYGKSISVKDLASKIISVSGKDLRIGHDLSKLPNVIDTKLALDSGKAFRDLGWEPKISLEEGIKRTWDWHELNIKK